MSFIAVAVGGASLVGGIMSAKSQAKAAGKASDAQVQAAQLGVDEQRRQFDAIQALLQPYVNAGINPLNMQLNLVGANGEQAQNEAVQNIYNSPEFQTMNKAGINSLQQNAAATGGLRGGNLQAAMAEFSPNLLNNLITQKYNQFGGLVSLGQSSAAGVGNAGMKTGSNIANLLQQSGAAQAGNYMAQGQAQANMWNMLPQTAGMFRRFIKGGF